MASDDKLHITGEQLRMRHSMWAIKVVAIAVCDICNRHTKTNAHNFTINKRSQMVSYIHVCTYALISYA